MKLFKRLLVLGALLVIPNLAFAACANTWTVLDGAGATKTFCRGSDGTNYVSFFNLANSTGANIASVLAASTQSAATDTSLVVQINPNQPALSTAQPGNFTQIGGNTVDTSSGNKSTGSQRVAIATDDLAHAAWGQGAAAAAVPTGLTYPGVSSSGLGINIVACDQHIFKHITSATDTLAVQGVTSKKIKICGVKAQFAGTATFYLENTASTNANCSSTLTQIGGLVSGVANVSDGFYSPFWGGYVNTVSHGLCINSTGTGGVDIEIWYTQEA